MVTAATVLVARLDNAGDVLLQGPLVRAVAAGGRPGRLPAPARAARQAAAAAARRRRGLDLALPVDRRRPAAGRPGRRRRAHRRGSRALAPDEAVISTSFHQSPLPLALLLRTGRRAADLPRSASTTRARCSTSGTGSTTTCPSPSARCPWPPRPGSRLPPATTAGSRCAGRCRPVGALTAGLRRLHPGASRAGPGLAARALRRGGRGAGRRGPPGGGHRRPGRARR